MPRYLLALYDDPAEYQDLPPEELRGIIEKYRAWTRKLEDKGHLVTSDKLRDGSGRVLRGGRDGRAQVVDGPYSESKEVLGGFFLLEAASYDEAVELCRDSPHLESSGAIEIREVDEL